MAKQTAIPCIVIVIVFILAVPLSARPRIQTTQKTIMLDPGHGGRDTGIVSTTEFMEKNITLDLAQRTARLLEDQYNVLFTRSKDINLTFKERMGIANQTRADLFISFHVNISNPEAAFGYYFESSQPSRAGRQWKTVGDRYKIQSKKAAGAFLKIFSRPGTDIGFYVDGAPLIALQGALMPAVLIEPLSIASLPRQPKPYEKYLDKYAALIAESIDYYFDEIADQPPPIHHQKK